VHLKQETTLLFAGTPPTRGHLGALTEVLTVALGSGGAITVLAASLTLRDNEKQLLVRKTALEREWGAGDLDVVAEVNEELIAETLSIMLGLSSDGAGEVGQEPAARRPQFAPAAMTDDDREIWSMS
jgi:hypothetical protein